MNDSNQPEPIETDDLELVPEYAVSGWVKYT